MKGHPARRLLKLVGKAQGYATSEELSDRGAHEARRLLKKARAVLRLLRPWLGDKVYRRENVVLRDAAREISPLRDAKVQIDLLHSLRAHQPSSWPGAGLKPLNDKLQSELGRTRRRMHADGHGVKRTAQS